MSKPKKFRSLKEVYMTGETYKREEPEPAKHKRLTGMYGEVLLREKWRVDLTNLGDQMPGPHHTLEVDADDLPEIRNLATTASNEGRKYIKEWCASANFDYPDYVNSMNGLMNTFNFGDWKGIIKFIKDKQNKKVVKLESIFQDRFGDAPLLEGGLLDTCTRLLRHDQDHGTPEDAGRAFFDGLMRLKHKVGGTSVGDGEFALALLTDGVKGTKETGGDIAVPLLDGNNRRYEVGTMGKQIHGSESAARGGQKRVKFSRENWEAMRTELAQAMTDIPEATAPVVAAPPVDPAADPATSGEMEVSTSAPAPQNPALGFDIVDKYVQELFLPAKKAHLQMNTRTTIATLLHQALRNNPNDDLRNLSECQLIMGAAMLYYYINHHEDHVILIIKMPHQKFTKVPDYYARFLKVQGRFDDTLKAIRQKQFEVKIDPSGVFRIYIPNIAAAA